MTSLDKTELQLLEVQIERLRQERLKRVGRFMYTLADGEMPDELKLACILEEVAEVGKNLLARAGLVQDGDPSQEAIYTEVKQIAALSVAWMERLTTQSAGPPYVRVERLLRAEIKSAQQELRDPNFGALQGYRDDVRYIEEDGLEPGNRCRNCLELIA